MAPLEKWVEESVLLVLFLVSTAANSLALLVFCRRPGLRTISNRFVINLLATNLVTTLLLGPTLIGERVQGEGGAGAGGVWAGAADCAAATCSLAALLAVLLIAVDQHHAVTDPLRCHARVLQRRPASLIAAAWALAAAAGALRAALAAWRLSDPAPASLAARLEAAYAGAYLAAGVAAPAVAVCVMYARIYRAARSSGLRARAQGASALQLHEPHAALPDLAEEGDGLTLRIDGKRDSDGQEAIKFGPFLLPPEKPKRCPSVASLRAHSTRRDGKSSEDLRRLPSVSSAPTLAVPLLPQANRSSPPSKITSLKCRISNASLFKYREESRAARVGLLTAGLVLLHAPHALAALARAVGGASVAGGARTPALALLVLAAATSPFLFALRSRRVQREARRLLLPHKALLGGGAALAGAAAVEGQRARAALELLRTLSPGEAGAGGGAGAGTPPGQPARSSFSSGASTQLSSASDE